MPAVTTVVKGINAQQLEAFNRQYAASPAKFTLGLQAKDHLGRSRARQPRQSGQVDPGRTANREADARLFGSAWLVERGG